MRYLPGSSQGIPLREVNSYDYFPGHQFFMEYGLKNSIRAAIKHRSLWKLFNRKKGESQHVMIKHACFYSRGQIINDQALSRREGWT